MIAALLTFLLSALSIHWVLYLVVGDRPFRGIPVVGQERGEWSSRPALVRFLKCGRELTFEGLAKVNMEEKMCSYPPSIPSKIMTDTL